MRSLRALSMKYFFRVYVLPGGRGDAAYLRHGKFSGTSEGCMCKAPHRSAKTNHLWKCITRVWGHSQLPAKGSVCQPKGSKTMVLKFGSMATVSGAAAWSTARARREDDQQHQGTEETKTGTLKGVPAESQKWFARFRQSIGTLGLSLPWWPRPVLK